MARNFWKTLKKRSEPILALAPLAGFTDSAFRQIGWSYGAAVLYSEMASATALFYNPQIKGNQTLKLLEFNPIREKYYVVQLFGAQPEHFAVAARLISQHIRPDGLDINFGCPVPKIIKQGAGSGLMLDIRRARLVIEAVLANTDLPVSIKIRAGVKDVSALDFIQAIADLPIAAIMIHGRTLQQGFSGPVDWQLMKQARRYFSGIILANGGINDLATAQQALKISQADGLGLARGALGRPWLFKEIITNQQIDLSLPEVFKIALRQATLVNQYKGRSGIIGLRKHLVWYLMGRPGASRLREQLVKVSSLEDVKKILIASVINKK